MENENKSWLDNKSLEDLYKLEKIAQCKLRRQGRSYPLFMLLELELRIYELENKQKAIYF